MSSQVSMDLPTRPAAVGLYSDLRRYLVVACLALAAFGAQAQVSFPLGSNGSMGLGSPNGDFSIAQDDLRVKVPGGVVRINRDFDGSQWVFNRQWSGLGDPKYYKASYASIGAYFSCTIIDGINSCDTTATSGNTVQIVPDSLDRKIEQTRVPNDPYFGRDFEGNELPDLSTIQFIARKGVGFTRSTDGSSYVSSKYPRFLVRPQVVPTLPASAGPDAHPASGKPGQGGIATNPVNGFRWIDRSGEWIEYDNLGRVTSYGDRNDVRVWFQYGSHGQIERVLDDNGRTVFTLLYAGSGNFITEVRDHTPVDGIIRRVQYQYDDKGRLRHVIDARGHTTSYDYGSIDSFSYDGPGFMGTTSSGTSTGSTALLVDTRFRITKVTDTENRATDIAYGVTARVTRITAPDGGVTEFEYGYDKLKKEFSTTIKYPQTASGRKIETRHYDQEGRVVYREVNGKTLMTAQGDRKSMSYTDERASTVQIQRDNFDEVIRRTNPDGTSIVVSYDSTSTDPKEVVDEAGVASRMAYDSKGNLLKLTAAAGKPEEQITEYEPNAKGEPEVVRRKGGVNPDGSTDPDVEVQLRYDTNGNVREVIDGEGKIWTYEYDAMGNMLKAFDPLNHEWSYTYDAHGNRLTATDPNQLTTHFSYDNADRLLTITDPREQVYRLDYDPVGRPQKLTDPTGASITLEYDKAGRVTSSVDAMNQRFALAYDNLDRVTSLTDVENNTTSLDYTDVDGTDRGSKLVSRINYPTLQQLLRYNGRRQQTQFAEVADGETRTWSAEYDQRSALKSVTNPYTKSQHIEYDALGRPTLTKDELGHTIKLGYSHRGNLVSVTDELGHSTRLEYDGRDKLVKETNAVGQATIYRYDDAGRLQELIRQNGFKLTFEFDAGGRLRQRQSYRPDGSLELSDSFSWDDGNRVIGWTTRNASSTLTHDDANRLLSETVTVEGVSLTRSYTYYPNGQRKTYTGPDGVTLTYAYDGNGKLSRVDIPGEGTMSVAERQVTEAKKVVLPGGTVQEVERNGLLAPTRLRVRNPSQAVVFDQQSTYGQLDEVTSRTTQGQEIDYAYDDALRLLKADPTGWSGATETFEVDAAGNRLSDNRVQSPWVYDDANRLTRRGDVSYQYDEAGNLITKTDAALAEPQRTTHYAYDGYNRLIEVRNGVDELVARYAYDPFGYRLSKEVTAAGATSGGVTAGKRFFMQAEEGLLAEVGSDGVVLQSYGWEPDHSYSTSPLFLHKGSDYFYYHNDPLGMPRQLTDKSGNVVWSAGLVTAFGKVTIAAGSAIEQPWRFPGQYFDAETGLHYNLHRYYDAETGRYTTHDPVGLQGGINGYAYADALPTGLIDPYGLWVEHPDTGDGFLDNVADATFGTLYWLTDGWSPSQALVNGSAALGDGIVSGLTGGLGDLSAVRDWLGIDGGVDKCSSEYRAWHTVGNVFGTFALPVGRIGYAVQASRLNRLKSAREAFDMRNRLKELYRGGPTLSKFVEFILRHPAENFEALLKLKGEAGLIEGSARTSRGWNALALLSLIYQMQTFEPDDGGGDECECS